MRRTTVLRHVHFEDLGSLSLPLAERNYQVHYVDVGLDDIDAQVGMDTELLIVLGGPIGVYEHTIYPFLDQELAVLKRRMAANRATLGICLGAQLMAWALGADVRPGPQKEIGWARVELSDAGRDGPLRHLSDVPVLHWHGDMLDLPAGAVRLASTNICPNQAFAVGRNLLGFQFHPENDGAGFERWLIGHAAEISHAPGVTVPQLRDQCAKYAAAAGAAGQKCLREWLDGLR